MTLCQRLFPRRWEVGENTIGLQGKRKIRFTQLVDWTMRSRKWMREDGQWINCSSYCDPTATEARGTFLRYCVFCPVELRVLDRRSLRGLLFAPQMHKSFGLPERNERRLLSSSVGWPLHSLLCTCIAAIVLAHNHKSGVYRIVHPCLLKGKRHLHFYPIPASRSKLCFYSFL